MDEDGNKYILDSQGNKIYAKYDDDGNIMFINAEGK